MTFRDIAGTMMLLRQRSVFTRWQRWFEWGMMVGGSRIWRQECGYMIYRRQGLLTLSQVELKILNRSRVDGCKTFSFHMCQICLMFNCLFQRWRWEFNIHAESERRPRSFSMNPSAVPGDFQQAALLTNHWPLARTSQWRHWRESVRWEMCGKAEWHLRVKWSETWGA